MARCSYCRCETDKSTCPNCGASITNDISIVKKSNNISSSKYDYNDTKIDNTIKSLENLEGCLGKRLITFTVTWLIMIILGIILTNLLRKNDIDFIKKYHNILQVVRFFLLSFGWIPALFLARKKS